MTGQIRALPTDAQRAGTEMSEYLAVATRTDGVGFDRSLEIVTRRELARLLDLRVTLEELLTTVPGGGSDGQR